MVMRGRPEHSDGYSLEVNYPPQAYTLFFSWQGPFMGFQELEEVELPRWKKWVSEC